MRGPRCNFELAWTARGRFGSRMLGGTVPAVAVEPLHLPSTVYPWQWLPRTVLAGLTVCVDQGPDGAWRVGCALSGLPDVVTSTLAHPVETRSEVRRPLTSSQQLVERDRQIPD